MRTPNNVETYFYQNLESLKNRKDPEALKAAAKEMETNFAYQMIKTMRETTNTLSENNLGGSVYLSLFDMELARIFAERGLGLQDIIFKELSNNSIRKSYRKESSEHPKIFSNDTNNKENIFNHPIKSEAKISSDCVLRSDPFTDKQKFHHGLDISAPTESSEHPKIFSNDTNNKENIFNHPIKSKAKISSDYGLRSDPFTDKQKFHHGLDISAPTGTNIYPIRKGNVIYSGKQSGYGNVVIIDHGNGLISKYAHNKINSVKVGDHVDTNMIIAQVGSSGRATGPHLHLEIRDKDNQSIDPEKLIAMK